MIKIYKNIGYMTDSYGKIVGYKLKLLDGQGSEIYMHVDALKKAIYNRVIRVINLELKKDGSLVYIKAEDKLTKKKYVQFDQSRLNTIISKAKLLGRVKEIDTASRNKSLLITTSTGISESHILYIPDDVTRLNADEDNLVFTRAIRNLHGTIKVIGGNGLVDVYAMFCGCNAEYYDFEHFNTSNITNMQEMFEDCSAYVLDLHTFDTRNVTNMNQMFAVSQAEIIDLSSFRTDKVTDMTAMFQECNVKKLDLRNFNTDRVKSFAFMFEGCLANEIDLTSFNMTDGLDYESINAMFRSCNSDIKYSDSIKKYLSDFRLYMT